MPDSWETTYSFDPDDATAMPPSIPTATWRHGTSQSFRPAATPDDNGVGVPRQWGAGASTTAPDPSLSMAPDSAITAHSPAPRCG